MPTTTTATSKPQTTTTTSLITTTSTIPRFETSIETVDAEALSHSWKEGCPVAPEDLRLIALSYWGFDGTVRRGEVIVHDDEARAVVEMFEVLFDNGYPIESLIPVGELPEDAEDAPGYSNTSGFHCRVVAGTNRWSEHAYGRAIDINPHLNPLVDKGEVWPVGSDEYVDRSLGEPGMITDGDVVVQAFAAVGWGWGGHWTSLKDYHHFSATGR